MTPRPPRRTAIPHGESIDTPDGTPPATRNMQCRPPCSAHADRTDTRYGWPQYWRYCRSSSMHPATPGRRPAGKNSRTRRIPGKPRLDCPARWMDEYRRARTLPRSTPAAGAAAGPSARPHVAKYRKMLHRSRKHHRAYPQRTCSSYPAPTCAGEGRHPATTGLPAPD